MTCHCWSAARSWYPTGHRDALRGQAQRHGRYASGHVPGDAISRTCRDEMPLGGATRIPVSVRERVRVRATGCLSGMTVGDPTQAEVPATSSGSSYLAGPPPKLAPHPSVPVARGTTPPIRGMHTDFCFAMSAHSGVMRAPRWIPPPRLPPGWEEQGRPATSPGRDLRCRFHSSCAPGGGIPVLIAGRSIHECAAVSRTSSNLRDAIVTMGIARLGVTILPRQCRLLVIQGRGSAGAPGTLLPPPRVGAPTCASQAPAAGVLAPAAHVGDGARPCLLTTRPNVAAHRARCGGLGT